MKAVLAIAKYTLIEQMRNRLYLIILLFGAGILAASLLVGALAAEHRLRVIFDLGLLAIELFGLATAVFGAVSLIIQEIESKTIYLLMTRPVKRSLYIFGRYAGLLSAVFLTMLAMAFFHLAVMVFNPIEFKYFMEGQPFWRIYFLILGMSGMKIFIITSVALFFSLFASSPVSALVFTAFFWVGGHFGSELVFLIERALSGPIRLIAHGLSYLFPNFQYFNLRDTFPFPAFPDLSFILWALLYAVGYTGSCLFLSSVLFSRKEF